MKIVTWNINGIKARVEVAAGWLERERPDVVCLQEIKSVDEGFPGGVFEELGYKVATHGQKGFNGVAILSRLGLEDVSRGLPGDEADVQARYIEATVVEGKEAVRIGCLYLPNGNSPDVLPQGTEKFTYKLAWMDRLEAHAKVLLAGEMPVVLAGDYNVIPMPDDAKRPEAWTGDALFQPESRAAWRRLVNLGFTDAVRCCNPGPGVYTFWDYQAGAFEKDNGIRIDHLLLSPQAANRMVSAGVDRGPRSLEKPSDHTPAWVELAAA